MESSNQQALLGEKSTADASIPFLAWIRPPGFGILEHLARLLPQESQKIEASLRKAQLRTDHRVAE